jgi:microcystin-dependent protein
MSSPFVAEIRMFGGNFAPTGWASCDGQLMPISQNTALFSLLGTFYGGDGKSTFALPQLEGASPMGAGDGTGLSQRFLGEMFGTPNVTLLTSDIPAHNHLIEAYQDDLATGVVPGPTQVIGKAKGGAVPFRPNSNTTMALDSLTITGQSFPHNNMMPFLTVYFIIALQGVFPPRT